MLVYKYSAYQIYVPPCLLACFLNLIYTIAWLLSGKLTFPLNWKIHKKLLDLYPK